MLKAIIGSVVQATIIPIFLLCFEKLGDIHRILESQD